MAIIEVRNVCKKFDRVIALEQVSLTIEPGEIVGLLGPNGSGKTTLMRLLCSYFPPTLGHVCIAGYDTRLASCEARRYVGYAMEGVVLYPDLTVRDFLEFVRTVKKASRQQLETVVAQCGLEGWLERRIGALSKGYRQRVVLAQAFLGDPPILILDEPTAGVDPELAVRIRQQIKELAGQRTVLLSTHSLAEMHQLCTRVVVLSQGRILATGAPHQLFSLQAADATPEELFLQLMKGSVVNQATQATDARVGIEGH